MGDTGAANYAPRSNFPMVNIPKLQVAKPRPTGGLFASCCGSGAPPRDQEELARESGAAGLKWKLDTDMWPVHAAAHEYYRGSPLHYQEFRIEKPDEEAERRRARPPGR